jgi:hypothetical protein
MAYGLAEGLRKTKVRFGGKKGKEAVVIATFGNHFTLNTALKLFEKEGLRTETEKGHIVRIFLDRNTEERAEHVRKIIRENFGYVEPP